MIFILSSAADGLSNRVIGREGSMAKSSVLNVMISSRCNDKYPAGEGGRPLSEIRKELKKEIERLNVFRRKMFEVWINEETPPQGGTWDSSEVCLRAVVDCDILIVLYNGNAGWAQEEGENGICHAEWDKGLSQAPGKVWMIDISDEKSLAELKKLKRNARFQEYRKTQTPFRGGEVKTVDDLKTRVKEALSDALISLAQAGVRESSRGRFDHGDALNWSRLDFVAREQEMLKILRGAISQRSGSRTEGKNVVVRLADTNILLVPHAIPASFSIGPAKEMVGQPFLHDHELADELTDDCGGPVHVIACYKTATEAQAIKLLGFPDATVVPTLFGIFVADNIQKVQFAFIANCRDETNTRQGIQYLFTWLAQSGEEVYVAERAIARAKIVHVIAEEARTKSGASVKETFA